MEKYNEDMLKDIPLLNDLIKNFTLAEILKFFDPKIIDIYMFLNSGDGIIYDVEITDEDIHNYVKFIDFTTLGDKQYKLISKYITDNNFPSFYTLLNNINIRDCLTPHLPYNVVSLCPYFDLIEKQWFEHNFEKILESDPHLLDKFIVCKYSYIYYKIENIRPVIRCKKDFKEKIGDDFINASKDGFIEVVKCIYESMIKQLIEEELDVGFTNLEFKIGRSLVCACENEHMDVIKYLVEEVKVYVDSLLDSPIRRACYGGKLKAVNYLLEKGVYSLDDKDYCLRIACKDNNTEIAKVLIENGADVNSFDKYSLNLCILNNNIDLAKCMMDKGVDINENIITLTIMQNNYRMFIYFIEKVSDNEINKNNLLLMAFCRGATDIVKYLIEERGADASYCGINKMFI